ncbi:hypothetical protein LR003_01120 [candidate division NPL-UPA2 bacterium]|nr:hypothetical protein [candidate division NPL-UPA2 bacterium]
MDEKGMHAICELSNISFGLPKRKLLNKTFLLLAMNAGLDAVILAPLDKHLMTTLKAMQALPNKDEFCLQYITVSRAGKLDG